MTVKEVRVGDLFASGAQTLVNTVNGVGVMGKGLALEFKKRFPEMYEDYVARCDRREVQLGRPCLWTGSEPWILNFPTKDHWRSSARLSDIEDGLDHLVRHADQWGIESLAVPPLGCGQGGLDWTAVGPTLHRYLDRVAVPVFLYAPFGTPSEQLQLDFLGRYPKWSAELDATRIPSGLIALVEILQRVTERRFHPPVGRTKFHKLAYFATVAGIPTGLEFSRGSYGPFAEGLKAVQTRLSNNGLLDEESKGRMLVARVGRTFADARKHHEAALGSWQPAIERVADLLMRMDAQEAELAATVHLACTDLASGRDEAPSEEQVLDEVLEWKKRRRPPLDPSHVASTIRNLNWLGWIDAKPSDLPLPPEPFPDD